MKISKLADFAGVPRPTAIRKLESLQERGYVEINEKGYYAMPLHIVNSEQGLGTSRKVAKAIIDTAAILSKMDTGPIAGRNADSLTNKKTK